MPTLKKSEHLLTPADFQKVYERRRSASDDRLLVYACENDCGFSRIGLSVSKKAGNAVRRNRIKRLFREAFRLHKAELETGLDLVLIPRGCEVPTLEQLAQSLRLLVAQAAKRLRKRPAAPSL